jgi:hypothetical protein
MGTGEIVERTIKLLGVFWMLLAEDRPGLGGDATCKISFPGIAERFHRADQQAI